MKHQSALPKKLPKFHPSCSTNQFHLSVRFFIVLTRVYIIKTDKKILNLLLNLRSKGHFGEKMLHQNGVFPLYML